MATPFTAEGGLDLPGVARLATHLVETGTQTVLVNGTTGESPTLRGDERWQVLDAVMTAVQDRASVMMGTGTNDTDATIAATERATEMGADAILVVTPYYNRPDQAALVEHFQAVAGATDRPVVLYDIPARTAREIELATLVELSEVENIIGVKDATGDLGKAGDLLAATTDAPGGFAMWSGADELNLPLLALGAVGVVSVATHLVGPMIAEMIDVFPTDPGRARDLHLRCLRLHRALFLEPSPAPLKSGLRALGLPGGPVRRPLRDATESAAAEIEAALGAAGVTL